MTFVGNLENFIIHVTKIGDFHRVMQRSHKDEPLGPDNRDARGQSSSKTMTGCPAQRDLNRHAEASC